MPAVNCASMRFNQEEFVGVQAISRCGPGPRTIDPLPRPMIVSPGLRVRRRPVEAHDLNEILVRPTAQP
jgi:hypothetical protein